jgi:hypothetical protein
MDTRNKSGYDEVWRPGMAKKLIPALQSSHTLRRISSSRGLCCRPSVVLREESGSCEGGS